MNGDQARDEESTRLETEIRILDNVRWAIKDHPESAWDVITALVTNRIKKLDALLGR